ncbi:MAG: D-glycero-beta-D-manno-heptose-7-phosphate kinase [Deltaproteobacteria bacterium]|jgi:D-beta-D-heptose 7-phosphate kinase/D-beta-D-heptose 1-phosphate adenosyltransferase|nr:D-glycero-beta-D-manno-heptose-7-phosphate kinase [Deltaproteobacteria bacterium]
MPTTDDSKVLSEGIDKFSSCRILVVGDVIMDEFLWGRVERISPEAPVPVVQVEEESLVMGGAGNVVNNIISLGGQALLCGVIGNDAMGRELVHMLQKMNSPTHGLVVEGRRPTTIKTRVVAHSQQVVRVDREESEPVTEASIEKIITVIKEQLGSIDAIVVSDYGKGVVTNSLMDGLRSFGQGGQIILAVDPTVRNLALYKDVTLITPNNHEAQQMSGIHLKDHQSVKQAGVHLLKELNCQMVLITRGDKGMTLFEGNGETTEIPTVARKVFDVSGAGDTVIAAFTLAVASGLTPSEAAVLSNLAAGIVVGEIGTAAVAASRLKEILIDTASGRK